MNTFSHNWGEGAGGTCICYLPKMQMENISLTVKSKHKMFFQQHAFENVWKLINLMPIKIYI